MIWGTPIFGNTHFLVGELVTPENEHDWLEKSPIFNGEIHLQIVLFFVVGWLVSERSWVVGLVKSQKTLDINDVSFGFPSPKTKETPPAPSRAGN